MLVELQSVRFVRRWKRFLAEVETTDGRLLTVHCANSGSMKTLLPTTAEPAVQANLAAAIRYSNNPKRRLPATLVLLATEQGGWAMVDTSLPNGMASEAIANGVIGELSGYATVRREVAYGSRGSRIDLLLEDPSRPRCWVEVKNVTMWSAADPGRADFPDAITARGRKHLDELADRAAAGERAVMLYLVNRTDCSAAGIAEVIDAAYAAALRAAMAAGVEVLAYGSDLGLSALTVTRRLRFEPPLHAAG